MEQGTLPVQRNEGLFEAGEGLRLFEQWWRPESEPKAVVVIVHGYAEHSGRYIHVAEHLIRNGYAVDTFDLRGHGRSEGARAFVRSFDEYLEDLDLFLGRACKRNPEKPVFLLGHSMGGGITPLFVITRNADLQGLVISAGALQINKDISPLLIRISGIMGRLFPKLPTIKLDSSAISRDLEVVKLYDSDPLNYRGGTLARTGAEMVRATKRIQAQMETVSLPLLILHGTADRLTDVEGSRQLYARACSKDKTLKLYEGFYHEILNEPEKEQVMNDVVQWLDARL
jgi:alpha-beta hydrolase superfamily lysophospholipase